MRPIGNNDEVERAMPAAHLGHHRGAPAVVLDLDDFGAGHQTRGRALQPFVQQPEQRTAMDAESMRRLVEIGVGEVEYHVLKMVQPEEAVYPGAQLLHLIPEVEAAQHRKTGGLQQQARPGRPWFGEALEDSNAVPGVGEKRRGCLAGNTATDNSDVERSDRAQRPPLTTRHWPLT